MDAPIFRRTLFIAALVPGAATALALLPLMLVDINERWPTPLMVIPFLAAPPVALLVNWRWPYAATDNRALLAAIPQLLIPIAMMRLAVWLEYHGTRLEGSGEEGMAYGIGFIVSFLFGVVMVVLVAITGYIGWRLAQHHPASPTLT